MPRTRPVTGSTASELPQNLALTPLDDETPLWTKVENKAWFMLTTNIHEAFKHRSLSNHSISRYVDIVIIKN